MEKSRALKFWLTVAVAVSFVAFGTVATAEEESAAQAGEQVGVVATFVRVADTDEGWVVVGYSIANESVKNKWMLLDVGMTVKKGSKSQTISRDDVKLVTPDDTVLPLPTQKEFMKVRGELAAMTERANMMGESINYFPPEANQPCRIGFFADPTKPVADMAFDTVELNSQRACVGRLYFNVPDGIQYGNYNVDVKFSESVVKVPIKIMTKQEAKAFEKQWKEEKKEKK